ncbi:hypothetical protein OLEAN_C08510 [Oleispira antarctica RB-8]|uniref:Uncharacterized protein n=1 Tax=Oleispira antarctica RB-8 TaxID=698738 RepID=R4YKP5_OLEAN|nr:hypothetical protein OLEAN_C08510 [Oleispira antarctica RB-8]
MSMLLKNHLNAVAPALGMIPMSFEIHYDESEEENFNESWAEAFSELRRLEVCMVGYVLTKFEDGFKESVGKTVVLYAEDSQTEKSITDVMFQMELDVVHTGEMGVKYARGIEPSFFGVDRFTELLISDLKDINIVKTHSIASAL